MIHSMTGFAAQSGAALGFRWSWELRGVNGRGLDLRLRVPDWIEGLEAGLREKLGAALIRGNVTCNLRLTREDTAGGLAVNEAQLTSVLNALDVVEARAMDAGVSLAPSRATDILLVRGVFEQAAVEQDTKPLLAALLRDADGLIDAFNAMRAQEGAALKTVLEGQLAEMSRLTDEAAGILPARQDDMARALKANLAKVMDGTEGAEPDRVAQELALIAVKADVTEEIDRLRTHVTAAAGLIEGGGAVGRKLDFLMQEFNREANTLCSKAQHKALTRIGLALKAVIDQMREQVQNVE